MNRRIFCIASLSGVAPALSLSGPLSIAPRALLRRSADIDCGLDQFGRQYCTAGIKSFQAQQFAQTQDMSQWCWATAISMIFQHYGHPLLQPRIVAEAYGGIVNMPGGPFQILGALNRSWIDDAGVGFTSTADAVTTTNATAIQDLADNHPLLVGALGHAVVLTAMTFYPTMQGPQVVDAIVRDPWPTAPSRRSLTPQEWYNISLGARIRVQ